MNRSVSAAGAISADPAPWTARPASSTGTLPANPEVDPYFPIGQAALSLRAEGDNLRVALKTLTPNFKRYEIRVDGGEWKDSGDNFLWPVHPGSNRLEARTLNQFGVPGPLSTAEIDVANSR